MKSPQRYSAPGNNAGGRARPAPPVPAPPNQGRHRALCKHPRAHARVRVPTRGWTSPVGVCRGAHVPAAGDACATHRGSHACAFSKPRSHDKCARSNIRVTGHTDGLLLGTHFQPGINCAHEGKESSAARWVQKADGVGEKP